MSPLAEASLRQARALRGVAAGGLWPSVTASGSYQREHTAGYHAGETALAESLSSRTGCGMGLHIFGGVRRAVESASANIEAAYENLRDVQVTLIAEVALVTMSSSAATNSRSRSHRTI